LGMDQHAAILPDYRQSTHMTRTEQTPPDRSSRPASTDFSQKMATDPEEPFGLSGPPSAVQRVLPLDGKNWRGSEGQLTEWECPNFCVNGV
jgi:hypothetical protein